MAYLTPRQATASAMLATTRKAALSWKHNCPMDDSEQAMCDKAVANYEAAKREVAIAYSE